VKRSSDPQGRATQKLRVLVNTVLQSPIKPYGRGLESLRRVFTPKQTDDITRAIIGAGIEIHDAFGPGLFEKIYVPPLVWVLEDRGLKCRAHVPVSLEWRGRRLDRAYFIDILVEELVVVEVKAVDVLLPVHLAQTITYVRLAAKPAGLLINFNVKKLVDGVRRVVNDHPAKKPSVASVASE